ncbi:MAG: adenylate/guanylate cyclase domain-containing protein, partial [Salinisphaeraceae bacterium]|nr:adenylate/guanylate cyclase domain-containing protein [Salinisphaeraceae bacterium]
LTILFADIVGFTDVADRVEPEVMTEVLNEYLSCMVDIIEQHDGTLNEFAGDGLMALWCAPHSLPPENQAKQAISAALAMQAKMPELNEHWRKLGLGTELRIRVGINTGMVSVGSYGSQGRMTYTAIGLQTNIASRIESQAAPGQILISDATYQLIDDAIDCEAKGEVDCKGVHFPVKVYLPTLNKS